jgi:hypothetical protein
MMRRQTAVASENPVQLTRVTGESEHDRRMIAVGLLFVRVLCTTRGNQANNQFVNDTVLPNGARQWLSPQPRPIK